MPNAADGGKSFNQSGFLLNLLMKEWQKRNNNNNNNINKNQITFSHFTC